MQSWIRRHQRIAKVDTVPRGRACTTGYLKQRGTQQTIIERTIGYYGIMTIMARITLTGLVDWSQCNYGTAQSSRA